MADCITRSHYVVSVPPPAVATAVTKYYFNEDTTFTECFDYAPDYDYCKKRLAVAPVQLGATLNENYWEHKETEKKVYCSAYKDGNNDV